MVISFFFKLNALQYCNFNLKLDRPVRGKPLKLLLSPPKLPLIGNLHQLGAFLHRFLKRTDIQQQYGPLTLFHFGKVRTLVVSSVDMAREVMKTHDTVFASRPQMTAPGIYSTKAMTWLLRPTGTTGEKVQQFQYARVEEAAEMVDKIRIACLSESPIDLSKLLILTSNNIMCRSLQKNVFLLPLIILSAFILFSLTKSSSNGDEKRKLKLPPSPPRLPLIGNLHQLGTFPHQSLHALSKKYGDLMLVHLGKVPTLIVSSAEMAKEVMKTQDIAFCSRPKATAPGILFYDAHDIAFAPYGEYWRQVRKICVLELLSLKRVSQFQYARVEEVSELVEKIREASSLNGGGPIVLSDLLVATSNNIICRCILGQKFEGEENKWFGEVTKDLMCQLMSFSFTDYFGPRTNWLDRARGHIKHLTSIWSEFDRFFDKLIAEHQAAEKEGKPRKKDFVDILLQVQKDGNDFELKSDHLKALLQVPRAHYPTALFELSGKYGPLRLMHSGHAPTHVVSSAEFATEGTCWVLAFLDLGCLNSPFRLNFQCYGRFHWSSKIHLKPLVSAPLPPPLNQSLHL
ncbi:unnamed protein product [Malus baccata var. baccata]